MFGVNDLEITVYFAGYDSESAQENMPHDSYESAKSYADDNIGMSVFEARGMIDLTTMVELG